MVLGFSAVACATTSQHHGKLYNQMQNIQNEQNQLEDWYLQNQAVQTAQYIKEHDQQHPDSSDPSSTSNLPNAQDEADAPTQHPIVLQSGTMADQKGYDKPVESDGVLVSPSANQ